MKMNSTVSSYGKVYGYETECIPINQKEIVEIWEKHGRVVLGKSRPGDKEGNTKRAVS